MVKHMIRGEGKKEKVLEWFLEVTVEGDLRLCCSDNPKSHRTVFVIRSDGTAYRARCIDLAGLQRDSYGRIIMRELEGE